MPLFTRITLNPVNPDVRKVLRSPEAIHAVVSAATSGSSRPLWRLDGDRLYIVSDQLDTDRPDWASRSSTRSTTGRSSTRYRTVRHVASR